MKLEKDIKKKKKELKEKAKEKNGIWENFGQKKVRELQDKKHKYLKNKTGYRQARKIDKRIDKFEEWCSKGKFLQKWRKEGVIK